MGEKEEGAYSFGRGAELREAFGKPNGGLPTILTVIGGTGDA